MQPFKVFIALEPDGLRVARLVTSNFNEEIAAAQLLASLKTELACLDEAIRQHWPPTAPRRRSRNGKQHLSVVPTTN
jgi:hypothetical protein